MQNQQSINIDIISYSYEGTTIFYQISVKFGIKQWIVQKRYSQFQELNRVLEMTFKQLPQLPKKTFVTFLVGKSIEQINERKYGLQRYLQALASRKEIFECEQTEQLIREELFKENIIEEVQSSEKFQQDINDIQKNQLNSEQVFINKRDQAQQTSFIENYIIDEKNNSFEQSDNQESTQILQKKSNQQAQLIIQMKQQLQEFYDQINEKDILISNFNQKELETQEYYNQQIYEKQYQINELNEQINYYQQSNQELQKQNQDILNYIEELKIKLQQSQQQSQQLEYQIHQQQSLIQQQLISKGYENLSQTQLQQIIIEQQKKIDELMEFSRQKELEFKHELEKHYIVESQRDDFFQENQLLKDQLEEQLLQKNEQLEIIEQLKVELEYLQIQIKDKQDLLDIQNELS